MRYLVSLIAGPALMMSSSTMAAAPRLDAPIGEQERIAGNPWLPWVLALIALLAIVLVVADDDGDPESP